MIDLDPHSLVTEYKRVLKPTGNLFIFTSYNLIGKYHEAFDHEFDTFQFMAWHKTNPIPNFFKKGFLNSIELIVCCWNKGHTWNFKSQKEMHNYFESPICMGKERARKEDGSVLHPTQKPLKLLRHLVEIASSPGDIVLDPFMGVGSTGIACKELGRNFVGIEISEEYFQYAKFNIASE
jgi:DNA modification methylase